MHHLLALAPLISAAAPHEDYAVPYRTLQQANQTLDPSASGDAGRQGSHASMSLGVAAAANIDAVRVSSSLMSANGWIAARSGRHQRPIGQA